MTTPNPDPFGRLRKRIDDALRKMRQNGMGDWPGAKALVDAAIALGALVSERDALQSKVRDMALDHLTSEGQWIERCDVLTAERDALKALLGEARKHLPLAAASWNEGEEADYSHNVREVLDIIARIDAARSAEGKTP